MVVLDKGLFFFVAIKGATCTRRREREREAERERERNDICIYNTYCTCPFRRILGLGLIRETPINTALELAYYVQAGIVAC